ncbi:TPM domain-containing protein [Altererythrobacter salegens]|uniref:TPM domain-containing protein n=1 Tax=Croceibacterium salegens TaxID=1737568 RepID=A0A6I4STE3_9SPHN|nr:TPM domain-containing protein [Croceibacterium salegens]MXO58287.1 TPM domain-containing protein [Croceibacterium salegens]
MMARLVALFAASLLAACAATAGGEDEQPQGRIRDFAGIIDAATEARLADRLTVAEREYGPQVGIVTVKSLDGRAIEDFATDYSNKWGLGDRTRNDGLIILIAPNERKVRIGTGLGIEQSYPDAWCQEVIDKTMLPQFRQGNFDRGLEGAADMIIARMRSHPTIPANDNAAVDARKAA